MLKQKIDIYKQKGLSLSYNTQQRQLPLIKDNKPVFDIVYAQVLQSVVRRLDVAFQNFFRRVKKQET